MTAVGRVSAVESSLLCEAHDFAGYPYHSDQQPALVLAIGDSYSAGEGLRGFTGHCYEDGTAAGDDGGNDCHRSAYAYSGFVLPDLAHDFWACSGALTAHVVEGPQWNEGIQLDKVNDRYAVVTMTVGGNDLGFAPALAACMSLNLSTDVGSVGLSRVLGTVDDSDLGSNDCDGWLAFAEQKISSGAIYERLVDTYRQILSRMGRSAKLLIGTYPNIFPGTYTGTAASDGGRFCVAATAEHEVVATLVPGSIPAYDDAHLGFLRVGRWPIPRHAGLVQRRDPAGCELPR